MCNTSNAAFWHERMILERRRAASLHTPDVETLNRRIRILELHEIRLEGTNVSAQELSLVRIASARLQNQLADRWEEMTTSEFHL